MMKNKAFIFDMDGVIVNSEPVWSRYEEKFMPELMGQDAYGKIKDQILGNSISRIYEAASVYGFNMDKNKFLEIYHQYAKLVYKEAKITKGIQNLMEKLISLDFKLGLVSVSRQDWIDIVLQRLKRQYFNFVLSLDSQGHEPKPSPKGYLTGMQKLEIKPRQTIILEDSEKGIRSAKKSGAYTICLIENLPKDYLPSGADLYVETVEELIKKVDYINL